MEQKIRDNSQHNEMEISLIPIGICVALIVGLSVFFANVVNLHAIVSILISIVVSGGGTYGVLFWLHHRDTDEAIEKYYQKHPPVYEVKNAKDLRALKQSKQQGKHAKKKIKPADDCVTTKSKDLNPNDNGTHQEVNYNQSKAPHNVFEHIHDVPEEKSDTNYKTKSANVAVYPIITEETEEFEQTYKFKSTFEDDAPVEDDDLADLDELENSVSRFNNEDEFAVNNVSNDLSDDSQYSAIDLSAYENEDEEIVDDVITESFDDEDDHGLNLFDALSQDEDVVADYENYNDDEDNHGLALHEVLEIPNVSTIELLADNVEETDEEAELEIEDGDSDVDEPYIDEALVIDVAPLTVAETLETIEKENKVEKDIIAKEIVTHGGRAAVSKLPTKPTARRSANANADENEEQSKSKATKLPGQKHTTLKHMRTKYDEEKLVKRDSHTRDEDALVSSAFADTGLIIDFDDADTTKTAQFANGESSLTSSNIHFDNYGNPIPTPKELHEATKSLGKLPVVRPPHHKSSNGGTRQKPVVPKGFGRPKVIEEVIAKTNQTKDTDVNADATTPVRKLPSLPAKKLSPVHNTSSSQKTSVTEIPAKNLLKPTSKLPHNPDADGLTMAQRLAALRAKKEEELQAKNEVIRQEEEETITSETILEEFINNNPRELGLSELLHTTDDDEDDNVSSELSKLLVDNEVSMSTNLNNFVEYDEDEMVALIRARRPKPVSSVPKLPPRIPKPSEMKNRRTMTK